MTTPPCAAPQLLRSSGRRSRTIAARDFDCSVTLMPRCSTNGTRTRVSGWFMPGSWHAGRRGSIPGRGDAELHHGVRLFERAGEFPCLVAALRSNGHAVLEVATVVVQAVQQVRDRETVRGDERAQ